MKHLELFAGIGGFRHALDLLTQDGVLAFQCVGFSEIDDKAKKTYKTIYKTDVEFDIGDIVNFTSNKKNIKALPNFELLTGGFPCQTFSMMGKQRGFNEDRGQMFFRIMDIVDQKTPKFILLENVKNLYTHDKGKTYARIETELRARGYKVFSDIFNTADFQLPQKRSRIIIFATKGRVPKDFDQNFSSQIIKDFFEKKGKTTSVLRYKTTLQLLERTVPQKYYLSERIKPTILADGSANFQSRSDINQIIARPLTASMHKMHRACQDNYYSQDFIDSNGKINHVLDYTKNQLARLAIRKLTPREAFKLQGFPSSYADRASQMGVADGALYKQAGNAVSVNVIYAILFFLVKNGVIYE